MAALKYCKKWAAVRGSSFPLQCISNTVQNSWQHVSVFLTEGTYCFLGRKSNSEALTLGKPIKQAHEHKPVNQVFPRMKLLKSHSPAPEAFGRDGHNQGYEKRMTMWPHGQSQQPGSLRQVVSLLCTLPWRQNGKMTISTSQECD